MEELNKAFKEELGKQSESILNPGQRINLKKLAEGSKLIFKTEKNAYSFEVTKKAGDKDYIRGNLTCDFFISEIEDVLIAGSAKDETSPLHTNYLVCGMCLLIRIPHKEFIRMGKGEEFSELDLKMHTEPGRSRTETMFTEKIVDFEKISPNKELTPEGIINKE